MKSKIKDNDQVALKITLDKAFDGDLFVHVFDRSGELIETAPVKKGVAKLHMSERKLKTGKAFVAPSLPEKSSKKPTVREMKRIKAHEPVFNMRLDDERLEVRIPEIIIDYWIYCICFISGKVIRHEDSRPVCGARVHICEVDSLYRFIFELPEYEVFRFRDDWLKELERVPEIPIPDPGPYAKDLMFDDPGSLVKTPTIPLPPPAKRAVPDTERTSFRMKEEMVALRPQPIPPILSPASMAALKSNSITIVREALLKNVDLIIPYLCFWPWWWNFVCDEITVVETDASGRFNAYLIYPCHGDKPDLYFWVEYQFGTVWETVYHPPIPCYTYWDYACGTEVTIRITDPRVPACDEEPDLTGRKVAIMSIGNNVSLDEIHGPGATSALEGLTTGGAPFGGRLEPHVWMSRSNLISAGITKYRWSYRRLTEADGVTPKISSWTTMIRKVGRHYAVVDPVTSDLNFPFYTLGPDTANLFEIKPLNPPVPGIEWVTLDAREDSASAFFVTTQLPHGLSGTPSTCDKAVQTAGKYELKLELFRSDNSLVDDWDAEGIDLHTATDPAPFGTGTVHTDLADEYYKLRNSAGKVTGFRMVLRVDNNCCGAEIKPITGPGLTTVGSANCGFIEYSPGASVNIAFEASHPNNFATFKFLTRRGLNRRVPESSIWVVPPAQVGDATALADAGTAFNQVGAFEYLKQVTVHTMLTSNTAPGTTPCNRAAFAERLEVEAMATDGWRKLCELNAAAVSSFALDTPCP